MADQNDKKKAIATPVRPVRASSPSWSVLRLFGNATDQVETIRVAI
jgi:hypothetical protein